MSGHGDIRENPPGGNVVPVPGARLASMTRAVQTMLDTGARPEDRFAAGRECWFASETLRLFLAVYLAEADARREWLAQNFDSFTGWVVEMGIPQGSASKLRAVGQVFGRQLLRLSEADRRCTSIEALNVCAQRVRLGQVDVATALADAAAYPVGELIDIRDGVPVAAWSAAGDDRAGGFQVVRAVECVCPSCGHRDTPTAFGVDEAPPT